MNHKLSIVVGDWSGDGHSQTERFVIESNLGRKDLLKAYKNSVKKTGVDLDKVCCEYEDDAVDFLVWEKLAAHGLTFDKLFDDDWDLEEAEESVKTKTRIAIYPDQFFKIYLFLIKVGNPNFEYKILDTQSEEIQIGGYGLFE